ncbi:MAG: ferredoxin--nitrite reductase [Pirellula sp.]|nr:ferredoxin--nitrite reductase [Pirellula sp.]
MIADAGFSEEQQQYLQGFVAGSDAARAARGLPTFAATLGLSAAEAVRPSEAAKAVPGGYYAADAIHVAAQDRQLAEGKKLTPEENAKRTKNPFEMWDEMRANAEAGRFPRGTDMFLYKYHGLFHVAPAQDSFMTRLRFHGGLTNAYQLRGVADIAEQFGGGYADITTRANLQVREIPARHAIDVVTSLIDLGIINRGAGADNIRNVTGSPTAGIDPDELIDTRPLTKAMHHHILQHSEMYGLPRKFNIAFDGGGTISALADTNDIGFTAVRVAEGDAEVPAGVYFRLELGGISGHKDFARDTGVLLRPEECIPAAAALVRAFSELGDRTDRKKARLKYVLDRLGFDGFLAAAEKYHGKPWRRFALDRCTTRRTADRAAHIGVYPQKQAGLFYVGVVLPVGRMRVDQLRGIAAIAERHGSGTIRLTVWQNLLISDVSEARLDEVKQELEALGLHWSATNIRAGLVACTGNGGCKFAASNTKRHAMQIAEYLETRVQIDQPLNIHLTGCHHSCAQHYLGDIGLLATKVSVGEEMVEGYHVYLGGGYGERQAIGRELMRNVTHNTVPQVLERLLSDYLERRHDDEESFFDYSRRYTTEELLQRLQPTPVSAMEGAV